MIHHSIKNPRYRLLFSLTSVYLVGSTILRLVLWGSYGSDVDTNLMDLLLVMITGAMNDLIELFYLLLPLSLYFWLVTPDTMKRRAHLVWLKVSVYLTLFFILYLFAAEYFFFEEFNSRFNLVAVDYLIYPHEVFINIWDSYPVLEFLIADGLLSMVLFKLIWPYVMAYLADENMMFVQRTGFLFTHVALLLLVINVFSTDTLAYSDDRINNQLSINGISSFFQAFRSNELDYDKFYRTSSDHEQLQRLLSQQLQIDRGVIAGAENGQLSRHHSMSDGLGKLNVVVIVEESFGSEYIGRLGNPNGLTPEFDALSKQGLFFTHAYASGTRTVRGLEAITASFPPIPSESIIKRPGSEHMVTWGEVMRLQGYHTSFLYGGFGYFDNMNYFYQQNGFDVSDRDQIPDPKFANIWGVSDEDLFAHAIDYYDQRERPFFSMIMTTSNHKPYTFPDDVAGVKASGGGREDGFRYADYALGQFFKQAKSHNWFDNTLFVVVADHGPRIYGRSQIPLHSYEIPLLLYSPAHIKPASDERLVSQLDIAPTVLGLLGLEYDAPFFGVDINGLPEGKSHPLLFNHNHDVALYNDNKLVVLGLQQSVSTYEYDSEQNTLKPAAEEPMLTQLAVAYYQLGFERFKTHDYQ